MMSRTFRCARPKNRTHICCPVFATSRAALGSLTDISLPGQTFYNRPMIVDRLTCKLVGELLSLAAPALTRTLSLSLPSSGSPPGYEYEKRDLLALSTTTAFNTSINRRDRLLGEARCIVCGDNDDLEHCHIIARSEPDAVSAKPFNFQS